MSYNTFSKDNIDFYLNEVAKEYKKINRNGPPAEIILVGGASTLINYSFREITSDLDGLFRANSNLKDIINKVGDKYNLPNGWLNADFIKTDSFSPKIYECSKYYKTFCHAIEIRTISEEYFIAMKLVSGRIYKKDFSDIVGVIKEMRANNKEINFDIVDKAVKKLYGDWNLIKLEAKEFLVKALITKDIDKLYNETIKLEEQNRDILLKTEKEHPILLNEDNLNDVLKYFESINNNNISKQNKQNRQSLSDEQNL